MRLTTHQSQVYQTKITGREKVNSHLLHNLKSNTRNYTFRLDFIKLFGDYKRNTDRVPEGKTVKSLRYEGLI